MRLTTLGLLLSCLAWADIISDQLLIARPGFPLTTLTITDDQEANAAPGVLASTSTTFLALHGDYCVQANCQEGQSNVSFVEPALTGISDTVVARLAVFSPTLDQITLTMFSDTDSGSPGGDAGEIFDVTRDLFTTSPAGFTVTAMSDVPEPGSWRLILFGLALSLLATRFRNRLSYKG